MIIAIAAAAIAPRIARDDGRRAEASARAVREVLSAAATRAELTGSRVALTFDAEARALRVMEFRWASEPTDWDAGARWAEDTLIPAAVLDDAELASVRADAAPIDPDRWTVEFGHGTRRPGLDLVVRQVNADRAWRIALPAGSLRAEIAPAGTSAPPTMPVVDLDAEGREDDPW